MHNLIIPCVVWDIIKEEEKEALITEYIERQWEFDLLSDDVIESDGDSDKGKHIQADMNYWVNNKQHRDAVSKVFRAAFQKEVAVEIVK